MKKKPSTYTRASRSNVTLKNFLNNLKENDLHFEDSQITQCVFLGVLRLKPVPSMFCASAVSTDGLLEVKNTNKRNRRIGSNNSNKESNTSHKTDINKVISGRISKKNTIRVKQSVKKVPTKQSILKVNFKMSKKPDIPSSNSIILSDTKIIPQCASFSREQSNPVQNLFDKLKQQMDERNHQHEGCKLKNKAGKKKTLQDRLPMPLQFSHIEVDSDSSGFKDDGITCSSSDANSISPVSQNSIDDPSTQVSSSKEIILIEDEESQRSEDVFIVDETAKSFLSIDTSQNSDVVILEPSPKTLRVSPRIKKAEMQELKITVPTNEDEDDNPSTSLLQTFVHASEKPRKRRRLMPAAMPSILFNAPMLLRSELAQKRPAQKVAPRLTRSQEKIAPKKSPEKTKNNDNLIYEVVKPPNVLETVSTSSKEVIVIDDMPPKVEPLILKLRVSQQKASTSKEASEGTSLLSPEKNNEPVQGSGVLPMNQVSVEQNKVVKCDQVQYIVIEDDEKPSGGIKIDTAEPSSKEIIIVVDEETVKSINSDTVQNQIVTLVKETVLMSQNNDKIIDKIAEQLDEKTVVDESATKVPLAEDSNLPERKDSNPEMIQECVVVLTDTIDFENTKKSPKQGQSLEPQNTIVAPETPNDSPKKSEIPDDIVLVDTKEEDTKMSEKVTLIESPTCPKTDSKTSETVKTVNTNSSIPKTVVPEISVPLLATSRVLRSEKSQQNVKTSSVELAKVLRSEKSQQQATKQNTKHSLIEASPVFSEKTQKMEQKIESTAAEHSAIDANHSAVETEELHNKITHSKSSEPNKKDSIFEIPLEATPKSQKLQPKLADQKNKIILMDQVQQETNNTVNIVEELGSEKTHNKNKSIVAEETRKVNYVDPPEATSRVLRSEKPPQKLPDQKSKSTSLPEAKKGNKEIVNIPPGATARVLRSEKIQQNITTAPEIKLKNKLGENATKNAGSGVEDIKTDSLEKLVTVEAKKSKGNKRRSLRSSIASVRSSSPVSERNKAVLQIHDEPKSNNKSSESENRLNSTKKVPTKKSVKTTEKSEPDIKQRRGKSKAPAENANKKQNNRTLKKHEKNKKIMKRVLRSSEIKHLQPGIAQDLAKTKSQGPKKAQKKQVKSLSMQSKITKMSKLRKIVSIKTKKIAKENNMLDWKNNEIIEKIIEELKSTIFKREPEDDGFQLIDKGKPKTAAKAKLKVKPVSRKIVKAPKQKANQINKISKNTPTKLQKRKFDSRMKKGDQAIKTKKKPSAPLKKKHQTDAIVSEAEETTVAEERSEDPKIPTGESKRTGGNRKIKLEISEETQEVVNEEASNKKSKEPRAGSRKSLRNMTSSVEHNVKQEKEPPKNVKPKKIKEQHSNSLMQHETVHPVEIQGTAFIIEVDGTLNEKKKAETTSKEANPVPIEDNVEETNKNELAPIETVAPHLEINYHVCIAAPPVVDKHETIVNPPEEFIAKRKNEDPEPPGPVKKPFTKKSSIIIHDDIVLPDEPAKTHASAFKPPPVDQKGDIAVFDFVESEPERRRDESQFAVPSGGRLWTRINVDKVRKRKKKLWSAFVENPAGRAAPQEKKYTAVLDEDDLVRIIPPPPDFKRETPRPPAGPARGEETGGGSGGGGGAFGPPCGTADVGVPLSGPPIKSESPMKQLTITEMFSKFAKKKDPPPRPALDDCQPIKSVHLEPPEGPWKIPVPQKGPIGYPGAGCYSRIENAPEDNGDDSDCESRAEWVPEEYAEYKFKYSAQKMMQIKPIFKCKVCLALLPSYYKLVKHKKCHENVDNPYNCMQCGALFNNVDDFSAHLRAHKGKHPYQCLKCNTGFWTKQTYDEHLPVHVLRKQKPTVKRFRCDICAKEFSKLCDVERHTRVHTGEKPCVCNICNKGFQQSHNLSKHMLTHLHIKPFQCEICNRQFGRNDVLNRHLLTHSIEKPIKCWVCQKGFIRHTQLVVHLMNRHPDHSLEDPDGRRPLEEEEEERQATTRKTEAGEEEGD